MRRLTETSHDSYKLGFINANQSFTGSFVRERLIIVRHVLLDLDSSVVTGFECLLVLGLGVVRAAGLH